MGFTSELFAVPKIDESLDVKTSLALFLYAEFMTKIEGSWYQKMIAEGHTFKFEDEQPDVAECLPKDENVLNLYLIYKNRYRKYFANLSTEDEDFDTPRIDWFGSYAGDKIDHILTKNSKTVFGQKIDDFRVLSKEDISKAIKAVKEISSGAQLVAVDIQNSFKCDEDSDNIIVTPSDGVEISFENGTLRRVYSEYEELYAVKDGSDLGYCWAADSMLNALTVAKFLTDYYYIIYVGGY